VNRRVFGATIPAGVLALLLCGTSPCLAGSICGTVRDGVTLQPVSNAAVFLFDNLDQYTGLYAGTDVAGHYCINDIPSGTYTIQVRVDNYLSAVVRGIVVDDATDVDVTTRPPLFLDQPWPNPATNDVTFSLDSPDGVDTQLEVYDVSGRLVMGWRGDGPAGGRTIRWNLQDANGNSIASGIYLVRLRAGGNDVVRRFVRLR
jgi:hypothetical protein